ncbi:unnamed protein product, partial [Effrenium voratum]
MDVHMHGSDPEAGVPVLSDGTDSAHLRPQDAIGHAELANRGEAGAASASVSPHAAGLREPLLPSASNDDMDSGNEAPSGELRRRALQRMTWRRTSPFSCELLTDCVVPCTKVDFFQRYKLRGSPELFRIEEAAGKRKPREVQEILQSLVPQQGDTVDFWEATYVPFPNTKIKIHAAHLAASLGSKEVLEWLQEHCSPDVLCYQSIIETTKEDNGRKQSECKMHYTPLLAALFMSQVETAIWIVEKAPATATIPNADGMSPLHIIAWTGLPSIPEETRFSALERIATTLVASKADLLQTVSSLKQRKDDFASRVRNKTALEIAVGPKSSFPKQMLHLLTQSYHFPTKSRLFIEVNLIAKANPYAAVQLLGKIQERAPNQVQESLRAEVMSYVRDASSDRHMKMFVETLKMSPIAGANLLGLLVGEPRVVDPQRYDLPLYTVLPNREMICTYQPVEGGTDDQPIWKNIGTEAEPRPVWHREFRRDLPSDPLLHTDVYEVKVKVLYLPGILNLKVVSILSLVWNNWDNMKVFSKMPIRAVIAGMWHRHVDLWRFCMFWLFLLPLGIESNK